MKSRHLRMGIGFLPLFEANGVKPKSKTALKYEFFFVQGLFTAVNQKIPPALVMMMLAGRSILDYEVAP